MIANLLTAVIILGIAAYQYLKSNLVKTFGLLISAIIANIVAFNYFEVLGKTFANIEFLANMLGKNGSIGWIQSTSFLLIFILVLAILITVIEKLVSKTTDLGDLSEKIGKPIIGVLAGAVISGALITALMVGPMADGKPYVRFDKQRLDLSKPKKSLLNTDGLAAGLFSKASSTSFSGQKSFAVVHADFLDQVALTKLYDSSTITVHNEIALPKKIALWPAQEKLTYKNDPTDSDIKTYERTGSEKLMIARIGIKALPKSGNNIVTMSQLRLICKPIADGKALSGKGKNIYPVGYMTDDVLIKTDISCKMEFNAEKMSSGVKWIDFAFSVPSDMIPVAAGIKMAGIVEIPASAIAKESLTASQLSQMEEN